MNIVTFTKGDLVQIPQGVMIYETTNPFGAKSISKQPKVGIFLHYDEKGHLAKILFSEGEWLCPIQSVNWCEARNVN